MSQSLDTRFGAELARATPLLRRRALALTRNAADASDLVQDTLLKAWRGRDQFHPGTSLVSWLVCIMRNAYFSDFRRRARAWTCELGDKALDQAAPPAQEWSVALHDVGRAIGELPHDIGEAVIYVGAMGASHAEGAARFACPEGTLKSRVSRGRQALRERCGAGLFA